MSLPWFAFNIKDYLSDTMRLTTEAHGAYLLLILDYYESEGPSPDDDFILAAIAQQDPHLGVKYATVRAIGAASPLDIAGLATDTYVVGAWGKYTKAGGEVCYGPATMGTQVVA